MTKIYARPLAMTALAILLAGRHPPAVRTMSPPTWIPPGLLGDDHSPAPEKPVPHRQQSAGRCRRQPAPPTPDLARHSQPARRRRMRAPKPIPPSRSPPPAPRHIQRRCTAPPELMRRLRRRSRPMPNATRQALASAAAPNRRCGRAASHRPVTRRHPPAIAPPTAGSAPVCGGAARPPLSPRPPQRPALYRRGQAGSAQSDAKCERRVPRRVLRLPWLSLPSLRRRSLLRPEPPSPRHRARSPLFRRCR